MNGKVLPVKCEKEKSSLTEISKDHKSAYPKKNLPELLNSLERRGVKFNIKNKEESTLVLEELNYYYKVTVYKRNFKKDEQGKYIDLDFAYLGELASVDMQLRYLLTSFTLDIEHSLKTFLMKKVTENDKTDGYDIIEGFIQSTKNSINPLSKEKLFMKANNTSSYQYSLYETHKDCPPIWAVIEIMSFGDLTRLITYYFKRFPDRDVDINSLKGLMMGVKKIRNCSVHNNPFLFDLSRGKLGSVNQYLHNYTREAKVGEMYLKCPKVHDVLCVLYMHDKYVKGPGSRHYRLTAFSSLIDRSLSRFHYLNSDNDIIQFFKVLNLMVDKYNWER